MIRFARNLFFSKERYRHTPFVNIGGSSTDFDLVGSSMGISSPCSSCILLVVRTTTIRVLGVIAVRATRVSDDSGNDEVFDCIVLHGFICVVLDPKWKRTMSEIV